MRQEYAFSQRRACGLMTMAVSSYRYQTQARRMSRCGRGWWSWRGRSRASGIGGCMCCCGEAGEQVNHKRVHRVYREAGLMIRRKKRKHCVREGKPLLALDGGRTRNGRWISCTMRWSAGGRSGC